MRWCGRNDRNASSPTPGATGDLGKRPEPTGEGGAGPARRLHKRHRTRTGSALGQSAGPFLEDGRGSGGNGATLRTGARCPSKVRGR